MWYNNKHIISRSFGVAFVVADDVQSFIFISCWWRKIDLRTISSGRFRINKCILYQVISRNTIEQIERTHGFDRKRMEQKKMKKKVHHVIESVELMDHPSFKTKTLTHTATIIDGNSCYLLGQYALLPACLLDRSPARMHARPIVHRIHFTRI